MGIDASVRAFTANLCLVALLVAAVVSAGASRAAEDRRVIDLDDYIVSQKPLAKGGRTIFRPRPIAFAARVKSHPERIKVEYLYEALAVSNVSPLPEVSHQMFVESAEGRIIAVYVEDQAVKGIVAGFALEAQADFDAYHVYNYSRGPAMVVEAVR